MLVLVRRGLGDVGYAEGRNVAIEYRFADGRYDRLSAQLTDLTQRKVAVIVFAGFVLVEQVRASLIPIIFGIGADPVRFGLVARINRPGGNVTGFNALVSERWESNWAFCMTLFRELRRLPCCPTRGREARQTGSKMRATLQRRSGRNCLSWKRAQPTRSTHNLPDSIVSRRMQCSSPAARFLSLGRGRLWRSQHAIASPQSTSGASLPKPAAS